LFGQFPFLRKLFADSACTGPIFQNATTNVMPDLVIEIVRRSDHAKGFVVEPMRWIVERTIGWLGGAAGSPRIGLAPHEHVDTQLWLAFEPTWERPRREQRSLVIERLIRATFPNLLRGGSREQQAGTQPDQPGCHDQPIGPCGERRTGPLQDLGQLTDAIGQRETRQIDRMLPRQAQKQRQGPAKAVELQVRPLPCVPPCAKNR
jgi:hypothetical protein